MAPPPGRRGGKFSKPTRGGGKHFSRDLQPLDKDGTPMGMWRDPAEKRDDSDESSEEDSSSEEESSDGLGSGGPSKSTAGNTSGLQTTELTREQRKEAARKKKMAALAKKNRKTAEVGDLPTSSSEEESEEDGDGLLANPNHSTKARAQARTAPVPAAAESSTAAPTSKKGTNDNLSRREREAIEKEAARERYQKLHAEGKTDEAKADMARLKLIRQQREEAAARKKAENEERAEESKKKQEEIDAREAKLRAAAMGGSGADSPTGRGGKKTRGKK